MWGVLALNTVGITVGTSHTTVSTPRGYQHFPVLEQVTPNENFANFIEKFGKADLEKIFAMTVMIIYLDKFSSSHRKE